MSWWRDLFTRDRGRSADPSVQVPTVVDLVPDALEPGASPPTQTLGTTSSGVEIVGFRAPADQLVAWWHRLRAEHPTTGLWPVLLGPDPGDLSTALTPESRDDHDDVAELRRAERTTLREVAALRAERFGEEEDEDVLAAEPPRVVAHHPARFTVTEEDGIVALVPAAHGWQVPVVLGWDGGVNYEMDTVDHAVVLRDWEERFGAQLVSLSGDQVLELLVERPPTDPAEALAVAREQYAYCPDVVDQGTESITALAAEQVGSRSWYFWWD